MTVKDLTWLLLQVHVEVEELSSINTKSNILQVCLLPRKGQGYATVARRCCVCFYERLDDAYLGTIYSKHRVGRSISLGAISNEEKEPID